jgi:hypothetical protein
MKGVSSEARTLYEVKAEIAYAARLFERHTRLYGRVSKYVKLATLALSIAPIASLLEKFPKELGLVFGAIVAVLSLCDVIWDPGKSAVTHEHHRKEYQRLMAKASGLSVDELDKLIDEYRIDDPVVFDSLKIPSQNDVLVALGHSQCRSLKPLERMFAAVS